MKYYSIFYVKNTGEIGCLICFKNQIQMLDTFPQLNISYAQGILFAIGSQTTQHLVSLLISKY